jgi:hypothetical protein
MDLKPPMPVGQTLLDAATGVAEGHKALVLSSKSDIGQLVVKTATITMDLDLTATHDETGFTLSLQPAFFAGLSGTEQKVAQHLTVQMNIVNVMADPAKTDAQIPATMAVLKSELENLWNQASKISDKTAADVIRATLKEIQSEVEAGDISTASRKLLSLLAKRPELHA